MQAKKVNQDYKNTVLKDCVYVIAGCNTHRYNPNSLAIKLAKLVRKYSFMRKLTYGFVYDKMFPKYRTFGYYKTFEEAENAVLKNSCDICEGTYYNYIVIEAVMDGVYPFALEMEWYNWVGDHDNGFYMKSGRPDQVFNVTKNFSYDCFKNTCNFGI